MVLRSENTIQFQAELRPNSSGTLRGTHIFFGFLLAAFIPTALVFTILGAWPVFGFMGVELLLLYGAFRLSRRRSTRVERISLSPVILTIEKIDHWGNLKTWSFPPQWLKVRVENPSRRDNRLKLFSHGKSLTIGTFLTPEERLEVASDLERALYPYQNV
jgi:uncharacterized membrane protein